MDSEPLLTVSCSHGSRPAAVVCRHLLNAKDHMVGFVENSSDPTDLQAWCDACESAFLREGDCTPEFVRFADVAVVCDLCYLEVKSRHCRFSPDGVPAATK